MRCTVLQLNTRMAGLQPKRVAYERIEEVSPFKVSAGQPIECRKDLFSVTNEEKFVAIRYLVNNNVVSLSSKSVTVFVMTINATQISGLVLAQTTLKSKNTS